MGSWTWGRFLKGVLLGTLCGVATFAIALVSGYSLAQVQMTSSGNAAASATPTAEQLQRVLERLTAPPAPVATPGATDWGVGTTYPTPEATAAGNATPASGTPTAASSTASGSSASSSQTLRGSAATPSASTFDEEDVTPQPTPQAGNAVIPTRTPFTPPTIIPIQPLGTPAGR
jgi:hypothetical protein